MNRFNPVTNETGQILANVAKKIRSDLELTTFGNSVLAEIEKKNVYSIDFDADDKLKLAPYALDMRYMLTVNGLSPDRVGEIMGTVFNSKRAAFNRTLGENNFLENDSPVDQLLFLLKMA